MFIKLNYSVTKTQSLFSGNYFQTEKYVSNKLCQNQQPSTLFTNRRWDPLRFLFLWPDSGEEWSGYPTSLLMQDIFQDITAVDPTTVIVSYSMRSSADYAEFALTNGVTIGGFLTYDNKREFLSKSSYFCPQIFLQTRFASLRRNLDSAKPYFSEYKNLSAYKPKFFFTG